MHAFRLVVLGDHWLRAESNGEGLQRTCIGAWLDANGEIHYPTAVGSVATSVDRETIKLADEELLRSTLLIAKIVMLLL